MTGTPASRSAVAWSVMAMVSDGRSEFTLGLMDVSTASARTAAILALAAGFLPPNALTKQTELEPEETGLVRVEKDGPDEAAAAAGVIEVASWQLPCPSA